MTLLKKHLAPIEQNVWDFIENEARDVLNQKLTCRNFVDTLGPKGMDYAAYNTGRSLKLDIDDGNAKYAVRNVLPLMEVEVPFTLKREEIEAFLRGAKDADIDNLLEAAGKIAEIENKTLLFGLEKAGITGLLDSAENGKIEMNDETGIIKPLTAALQLLRKGNVEKPFNLVVGQYLYSLLHTVDEEGYPLKSKIKDLIGGEIIFAEELGEEGLVIGSREEDFELIVGQDISIGFNRDMGGVIEFFFTESFTFKVNAPEAVIALNRK